MKKSVALGAVLLAGSISVVAQAAQQCIGGPGIYGGVTVTVDCSIPGAVLFDQPHAGYAKTIAIYVQQDCTFEFSSAVGSLSTAIIALDRDDGPMSYQLNNTAFTAQSSDLDGVTTPPTREDGCNSALSVESGNVVNPDFEGCGNAILTFTGQTNVTSLSIQGGGTFNAVCFSPLLQPQTLTLAPATASVPLGVGQSLTLAGVLGTGAVTYSVEGSGGVSCAISNDSASGATVTGTGSTGICSVTAAIAADATYDAATSNTGVVTITGTPHDVPVLGLWGIVTLMLSLGAVAGRRMGRRGGMPRV